MRIILTLFILFHIVSLGSALADCGAGRFTPLRAGPVQQTFWQPTPREHDTLFIVDPANQQYAAFDLEFGGILASLRYDPTGHVLDSSRNVNPAAVELIWGHHPGGMLQPAWSRGNDVYSHGGKTRRHRLDPLMPRLAERHSQLPKVALLFL